MTVSETTHLACDKCRYSGATVGHAVHVRAGQRCPYCTDGEIVEWSTADVVKMQRAIDELGVRLRRATRNAEEMEAERDDYKDRWETLSRVARRKIARLEAQLAPRETP